VKNDVYSAAAATPTAAPTKKKAYTAVPHTAQVRCNSWLRTRGGIMWGKGAPTIGNDVWIGRNVTIMSGVHVGDGSVVAANSVVSKNVAPYSIVAGNPARHVKYRYADADLVRDMIASEWWTLPEEVVARDLAPALADPRRWVELAVQARKEQGKNGGVVISMESMGSRFMSGGGFT
jgi:hypothetical protein